MAQPFDLKSAAVRFRLRQPGSYQLHGAPRLLPLLHRRHSSLLGRPRRPRQPAGGAHVLGGAPRPLRLDRTRQGSALRAVRGRGLDGDAGVRRFPRVHTTAVGRVRAVPGLGLRHRRLLLGRQPLHHRLRRLRCRCVLRAAIGYLLVGLSYVFSRPAVLDPRVGQHVKLWPTCVLCRRSLRLERTS